MASISIHRVSSRQDLRTFIYLPEKIHRSHPQWLPPLYADEEDFFDPHKNKAFTYCATALWLASRDGQVGGRIMGIIHHPYNARQGEKTVRFSHFDCFDDAELAQALLQTVEDWGRSHGMDTLVGPFGFSDKDPEGLQIEGFDQLPVMVTANNLPYLPTFLEARGYEKMLDCLDYAFDLSKGLPPRLAQLYDRLQARLPYRVTHFHSKRALQQVILPALRLVNDNYDHLYGFSPMTPAEMEALAARYLPILDPRYIKAIFHPTSGQLLAFMVGLPNFSRGIQRARGRLLPFGWLHILWAMKKASQLDLMLGAVDKAWRHRGLEVLLGVEMMRAAAAGGLCRMETHLVLETNQPMRAVYEKNGAALIKRFRIYQRSLG